tara:strand:+ start:1470 stop:3047 length:1578 start_codon:yes stop_codon:yes gene_type:complete
MSKVYENDHSLHEKIIAGVNKLADNVASTLGPRGRNVLLQEHGKRPIITKDGVTVANFIDFEDPFENAGAQILKQAADQTNERAGDGTTTATVLARDMLIKAQRHITAGCSPVELKRGMDKATEAIIEQLKNMATPVNELGHIEHVATISANNDKHIGKLIATAVDKAGKDGAINVEEARSMETTLDLVEGFVFDSGYISAQFINNERRGSVSYENPLILITDHKIEQVEEMLPILEIVARDGSPLLIVGEEVAGQALAALIVNVVRGTMKIAAVRAPRYGEERRNSLKDLALATGGTFVSRESGLALKDVKLKNLGRAQSVNVTKVTTTIVGGDGNPEEIEKKIDAIKTEIEQTESVQETEFLAQRITRLASGVAIIKVGAATEVEMIEKKHRIEDALEAVRAAQTEGIVPGGGIALLRALRGAQLDVDNPDQRMGASLVFDSLTAPIRQMAKNAAVSPDIVVSVVTSEDIDENTGYDFATDRVVDMFEEGIIDPVKVTCTALANASSVAAALITTNHAIVENG